MKKLLGKKEKKICPQKDPVLNYDLPPLEDFLLTENGIKHFRRMLEDEHSIENLECYLAMVSYSKTPSVASANKIWNTFVDRKATQTVNLTAVVYHDIEQRMDECKKAGKDYPTDLFDGAKGALLTLMKFNHWVNFKMKPQYFDPWLHDEKGTSIAKLNAAWWQQNLGNKWGNTGLECTNKVFRKFVEQPGNTVTKGYIGLKSISDPKNLSNLTVLVYWPADDVTRLCRLHRFDKLNQLFTATYFFNAVDYEEPLDTDWCIHKVEVTCASCREKTGPAKYCEVCGNKLYL
jgi:hypothetical protein